MAGILFEDIFDVKDIDPEGKKFDRVSRLHCESESFKMDLILDVNIQIYPVDLALPMCLMGGCLCGCRETQTICMVLKWILEFTC
ncbi:DNA-directed RNA polymerases I, II, and III subunit RPABC3 isoform X2 [Falco biarmicus]|uniref:DNA-directed RNA polymerases I, II, and III subunit RPABC3 isoform X2 n=1 Tax=Falco peregrinus TaxID=8954 RepID=UPI000386FB3F|nr:DNA-directed RNA polymerases I, II, and III subunit RPABC3 isoform X2 [Falco peregrinus]XP_005438528.1 DNA-directed RNA polymerases I, II, and III subunit RPABC3 isoform X2 [Falco cherrug]XP_037263433.1 DNA-directed RNA polymerases I, II, and III subunit RPABC3 isoform X2 [Falco rusticolus]XP_040469730.1 DNA-directed RNA polymerases I, II, and III subunit RPABC3 isoform X2 [Falco naumanni]XP_056215092.1 DNA-directed RNA polymerases I, II, and III subunit RPABC3 isoform X2 [Falco biarmicus]